MVGLHAVGLEDIGVDGALSEERHLVAHLAGLLLEHADELGADDLALGLGLGNAVEQGQEAVGSVNIDEVGVELVAEHVDDLLGLALAHEAVVHVHADELLADGLDQQGRDHGGVHAAGQGEQRLLVADLLAAGGDLLGDKGLSELRGGDADHVVGTLVEIHGAPFEDARDGRDGTSCRRDVIYHTALCLFRVIDAEESCGDDTISP